jgi:GNAT superfamily N-acetyltransferase
MDHASGLLMSRQLDLTDLHRIALLLDSEQVDAGVLAVRVLEHTLELEDTDLARAALHILRRSVDARHPRVLRRSFQVLALAEEPARYSSTLCAFFDRDTPVLDPETIEVLAEHDLAPEQLDAFLCEAESRWGHNGRPPSDPDTSRSILDFLALYGATHPGRFQVLRSFITRAAMAATSVELRDAAEDARWRLEVGFRNWLGPPTRIAVDPETGLEYRWEDVVAFSDEIDDESRGVLMTAIARTTMLREGIFLFSGGATVRLDDILPQGVWVRLIGSDHGKSVFRVAVKTRDGAQYDLAVNLNRQLLQDAVDEEINWLIVCGAERGRPPLVEMFGGHWPEHQLWTEEFIPGETLDHALTRLERRASSTDWYRSIWPFAAWSAIGAYIDFWNRTGRRLTIDDPDPGNVIVPMHDYHAGSRLVSISSRRPFTTLSDMLQSFQEQFIAAIERDHPRLAALAGWDVVFSAVLEIVGEVEGVHLLRQMLDDSEAPPDGAMTAALGPFLEAVERRGFLPRRLFFAGKRYRKWARLNPEATAAARAATLQEIFDTYQLGELQQRYPEVRPRFFLDTVFRESPPPLLEGIEEIVTRLRSEHIVPDEISSAVADLRARLTLDPADDYFLARLSFPYLRPEDQAEYVETDAGGIHQSEMVVTLEDRDGRPYRVRHAISPKEVARLHRLFLAARLPVQFRPEHRFLVAVNPRGHLIGGLFYEIQPENQSAHMDKVVVAEAFQGQGVAGGLIEELCNRLRTAGFRSLTTGFFRPQFFYRYGFTVERRYAGLVRPLLAESDE